MLRNIIFLSIVAIFSLMIACDSEPNKSSTQNEVYRPHDPWVFRSVLDKIPRVITLAMADKMWLAYSTEHGNLYKAWRGSVNFEGPVYDQKHGPQPSSQGDAYLKNELKMPWSILKAGTEQKINYQFRGHKFVADQVHLLYDLILKDQVIKVIEIPAVEETESGKQIFTREFLVSGLKDGDELSRTDIIESVVVKSDVSSEGTLEFVDTEIIEEGNKRFEKPTTKLIFKQDGASNLSIKFRDATILDPNLEEDDAADAPSGALLIAKHGCRTCHNKNLKTIGPAYVEVAKRYQTTEENRRMLVSKVKNGGSGIWGKQVMNAHPEVPDADLKDMIDYILSLDADAEVVVEKKPAAPSDDIVATNIDEESLVPGSIVRIYNVAPDITAIPKNMESTDAFMAGVLPNFDNITGGDFRELDEHFGLIADGYLKIPETGIYDFRIWSDDGSKVRLGGKWILDHDGPHGTSMKEVRLNLKAGFYPFRIEFYQGIGGKFLSWNYKPENAAQWMVIPPELISHDKSDHQKIGSLSLPMTNATKLPGDRFPLTEVHPSFDLFQARPIDFTPKVGGMDFMSDGSLIVSSWDPDGPVYRVSNIKAKDPDQIKVKKIASGLAEPLGIKIVDDEIYVMQKQELTHLIDNDKDGIIDEYRTLCDDFGVSSNFHEFGFGLEYKEGHFYAALATAIEPGGASTNPQIKDRGKLIKVNKETGAIEFIASGLRTPNGVGIGYNGELFVSDNEGDWLPSSKINHVQEGVFYGQRSVDMEGTKELEMTHPLVWLPQNEIGNSPSTPSYLNLGPYQNQMIHGEVTHGGVKRVFVEEIEGKLQGCVFRFIQGIEAGVNRLTWSDDGDLYVGGIGNPGNWQQNKKLWYGLQRLAYNKKSTFEMLAVRAKSNGLEIEFTEPLLEGEGWNPNDFELKRWWYKPTIEYGGPKMDETRLNIKTATVSDDRKKVFLEFDGLKNHHVFYVRIKNRFVSALNHSLWSTEAWYTMNAVPKGNNGIVKKAPAAIPPNTLTADEKAKGWKLLFNGKDFTGWRNFKKETIGKSWLIENGAMHLNSTQNDDGSWSAKDGGDIITEGQYENFELNLEWKIINCGNSGIMYNVQENDKYCCPWWTGPEMQVLDDTCHPDTKHVNHRAGCLYDMIETKYVTVNPAGEWNKVKIISNKGEVEFWLNGYKVVAFTMFNDEWKKMIAGSKFNEMPGFGEYKSGHICLQDHSDKVWYRNIKIKEF